MTTLPIITDLGFYAVAIPAVVLLGISKSGFGAGFGSLAVPMMALAVSVPQAAAILMPVLLLGLAAYRRDVDWAWLKLLLPYGLLGTALGTALFGVLPAPVVAAVVGVFTLLFLAQRVLFPPRPNAPAPGHVAGALLSVASGFTSFIAHAGGPPINAYLIPHRLAPVRFAATLAVFFFFINLSKWLPYAYLGLLDSRNFLTSLALLPWAPVGVALGVKVARRIPALWFYRFLYAGMLLTGCKLLWDGVKTVL